MAEEFIVTLVSNVNTLGVYEDNTRANFRTPLSRSLDLTGGKWEVALGEIYIPNYIANITPGMAVFDLSKVTDGTRIQDAANYVRKELGMNEFYNEKGVLEKVEMSTLNGDDFVDGSEEDADDDVFGAANLEDEILPHSDLEMNLEMEDEIETSKIKEVRERWFLADRDKVIVNVSEELEDKIFEEGKDGWLDGSLWRRKISIPSGTYGPNEFAAKFNEIVSTGRRPFGSRLDYLNHEKKFRFSVEAGESIRLKGIDVCKEMMGFGYNQNRKALAINIHETEISFYTLENPAYFGHDTEVAIVSCNVVKDSVIGADKAQYLRTADISDRNFHKGDLIHRVYNDSMYFPCKSASWPVVEINLRTLSGRDVDIIQGTTTVVLRFRKRQE